MDTARDFELLQPGLDQLFQAGLEFALEVQRRAMAAEAKAAEMDDNDEVETLELELAERLEREALSDTFFDEPIDAQVAPIAEGLELHSTTLPSWPASCRLPMIAGEAGPDAATPSGLDHQDRCSWMVGTSPTMTDHAGGGELTPHGPGDSS